MTTLGSRGLAAAEFEIDRLQHIVAAQRRDIDRLRTALRLCASQAGTPDAREGCRLIIATVKKTLG